MFDFLEDSVVKYARHLAFTTVSRQMKAILTAAV